TDLPHDQSFTALAGALADDPDVEELAPRLRQFAMLQPNKPDAYPQTTRGSDQLDYDHNKNGFAIQIGFDPLLETNVVDIPAWMQRGAAEFARWGRNAPPSPVFDEPDPQRLSKLRVSDEVEWRGRRRAGLPHDVDPEQHKSNLPGMVMGWRR